MELTPKNITKTITDIQTLGDKDTLLGHIREDNLHLAVLTAIAQGAKNPQELATAALGTKKLTFPKSYT